MLKVAEKEKINWIKQHKTKRCIASLLTQMFICEYLMLMTVPLCQENYLSALLGLQNKASLLLV